MSATPPAAEFDLIALIRSRVASRDDVVLGIGDDAALLQVPAGVQLVVAMDTLNEGVHFPPETAPCDLGWKALAVNLSDLAAMGAQPAWCTLSLSLPHADPAWLDGFIDGFLGLAALHGVALVGGDTTRGPLSICVTVHGFVKPGRALRRAAARVGDEIWISGTIGDAAAALALWRGDAIAAGQADAGAGSAVAGARAADSACDARRSQQGAEASGGCVQAHGETVSSNSTSTSNSNSNDDGNNSNRSSADDRNETASDGCNSGGARAGSRNPGSKQGEGSRDLDADALHGPGPGSPVARIGAGARTETGGCLDTGAGIGGDVSPPDTAATRAWLRSRLDRPTPRVELGLALSQYAHACVDVSDGLLADLGHVCVASGVGAELELESLPASDALRALFDPARYRVFQATGGDDYELCFTAPVAMRGRIEHASIEAGVPVTRIGRIVEAAGVHVCDRDGRAWQPARRGFEHFGR